MYFQKPRLVSGAWFLFSFLELERWKGSRWEKWQTRYWARGGGGLERVMVW
jgi:hypothetical protein